MMLEDTRRILAKEDAVADAVQKRAFGDDYMPPGDEDMGDIHVGDVNHPAPVVIQPPPPSNLMPMALLALAAAIPTTGAIGVAGYLLANRDKPVVAQPGFDDSTVKIGLGRIGDLEQGLSK